jgi:outer membrane protein TolC
VGPKYHRPDIPAAPVYRELAESDPWKTASPDEGLIRGAWWQLFEDPQLKASDEALRLEIDRYKAGTASYLDVITSQTIVLTNRRNVLALLQRRMTAAVTLIRAIGGGWTSANLPMP